MDLLIYTLVGIFVVLLLIWTFRVNRKERNKLTERLNKDFPHLERHKEVDDPDDLKAG